MNLFLDSSVLLAACGSETGASRALFDLASLNGWTLMVSPYPLFEVAKNLTLLPAVAAEAWPSLRAQLHAVEDVLSFDRPVVFPATKDRGFSSPPSRWRTSYCELLSNDDARPRCFDTCEVDRETGSRVQPHQLNCRTS